MSVFLKITRFLLSGLFALLSIGLLVAAATYIAIAPNLPRIDDIREIRLQVPLRIFTADRKLIAEFGEKRRNPVIFEEIPGPLVDAFLSAEDDRFYEHPGVDYQGLIRAAIELARTGEKRQGGSTITMQVARNVFLTREKSYLRKLREIFLALKIERELTKQEILELYVNKIYLGHRAYGIAAAAQVYYGKALDQLSVAQMAMIAGLPKAPSRFNPVTNPERALTRRNYVLGRMRDLDYLDEQTYRQALAEVDEAQLHATPVDVDGAYVAEMVRSQLFEQFGEAAYTDGYQVVTTVDSALQRAANGALRMGLQEYDIRHGYRGPEAHVDIADGATDEELAGLLGDYRILGGLEPALVLGTMEKSARLLRRDGTRIEIAWDGLSWARPYISANRRGAAPKSAGQVVKIGDIVRVSPEPNGKWRLAQLPAVEGALVSLNPNDGAIRALVGGFDFYRSKFNRAIQAKRQPGSNFKPFIYSAALEQGFTPASIINDAPVVFDDPKLENTWRPENYSGRFFGPTRLREALVQSRNLVSVRLLRAIGLDYAIDYISRFGFPDSALPRNLSLALGSGTLTPLELVTGYAALANGGYKVEPYLVKRILLEEDQSAVFEAAPRIAGLPCTAAAEAAAGSGSEPPAEIPTGTPPIEAVDCPENAALQVMTPQNNYLLTSMMQDVIKRGTGKRARELGRSDLAGKTGTTNDQQDAWFSGFNADVVTTAWVGFDQVEPLGRGETGGRAALPVWMKYMEVALKDSPPALHEEPPGLVTVRIDPRTGLLAGIDTPDPIFEIFREEFVPETVSEPGPATGTEIEGTGGGSPEPLF